MENEKRVELLQAQIVLLASVAHLLIRLTPQAHAALLLMKESLLARALASPGVTDLEYGAIEGLIDQLLQPHPPAP